jgi:hypothetical protein
MTTTADVLAELAARHHFTPDQVVELWQVCLMAGDEARRNGQCKGCGGRGCLRLRDGTARHPQA